MRRLRVEHERHPLDVLLRQHARRRAHGLARLEVRLPVEVLRLEVAHVVRVRRRDDHDIRWYLLVLAQQDDIADLELLPERALPARGARHAARVVDHARGLARLDRGLVSGERGGDVAPGRVLLLGGALQARRLARARGVPVRVRARGRDARDRLELPPARAVAVVAQLRHVALPHLVRRDTHLDALFAQHELLLPLPRLALPQLPHAPRNLPRRINPEQLLPPLSRVGLLVDVLPLAELGRRRVVDLLVEHRAAVVLHGILDSSDGEDERERERRRLRRWRPEDRKDLYDDECQEVQVGDAFQTSDQDASK